MPGQAAAREAGRAGLHLGRAFLLLLLLEGRKTLHERVPDPDLHGPHLRTTMTARGRRGRR
jgi:hypothetical protein